MHFILQGHATGQAISYHPLTVKAWVWGQARPWPMSILLIRRTDRKSPCTSNKRCPLTYWESTEYEN